MQRAARRWGGGLVLATCLLPAAHAQTVPAAPPTPVAAPRSDSVKTPAPTFVADTARTVTVVTAEPSDAVTRRLAWRIGAAIVVLTLSTLLLYNVRSR
jgi:acyl dehydratase